VRDGVVDDLHVQGVLKRDARAIPARHIGMRQTNAPISGYELC